MIPSPFHKAQIISVDSDYNRVFVRLFTKVWEGPAMAAQVLIPGPCDGVRIVQRQLPQIGTLGVVVPLDGDMRSLIWLGAIPLSANDAINTIEDQTFTSSEITWGGRWKIEDESSSISEMYPDGTSIQIGPNQNSPSGHRVNAAGLRAVVPLAQSDLVSNTPSPFPLTVTHATGTKVQISESGAVLVSGVSTVQAIDGSGCSWTLQNNGTMFVSGNLLVAGNIAAYSASGSATFTVSGSIAATEDIIASTAGNNISVTDHTHGGVQSGGSQTDAPTSNT
ncbi:MAG TPA: hypothetical protein VMF62_12350 [Acetobacteraceae bacterium]|nr:hypothetical protein [Acetobacteraceae bacterium]